MAPKMLHRCNCQRYCKSDKPVSYSTWKKHKPFRNAQSPSVGATSGAFQNNASHSSHGARNLSSAGASNSGHVASQSVGSGASGRPFPSVQSAASNANFGVNSNRAVQQPAPTSNFSHSATNNDAVNVNNTNQDWNMGGMDGPNNRRDGDFNDNEEPDRSE